METINIICVDDQQEVLDSVMRDLRPLTTHVRLEEASSVAEVLGCVRVLISLELGLLTFIHDQGQERLQPSLNPA